MSYATYVDDLLVMSTSKNGLLKSAKKLLHVLACI